MLSEISITPHKTWHCARPSESACSRYKFLPSHHKASKLLQTSATSSGLLLSSYKKQCTLYMGPFTTYSTFAPKASYSASAEHLFIAITTACKHRTTADPWLWSCAHPSNRNSIIPEALTTQQRKHHYHDLPTSIYNFMWSAKTRMKIRNASIDEFRSQQWYLVLAIFLSLIFQILVNVK